MNSQVDSLNDPRLFLRGIQRYNAISCYPSSTPTNSSHNTASSINRNNDYRVQSAPVSIVNDHDSNHRTSVTIQPSTTKTTIKDCCLCKNISTYSCAIYAIVAILITAATAAILIEFVAMSPNQDKGSAPVLQNTSCKTLFITIAFNVGAPYRRTFYHNDFVYKSLMPLIAQLNNNCTHFCIETYADSDKQTNFSKFTNNGDDILEILNEETSRSVVSKDPNQRSAVNKYAERLLYIYGNDTHIYVFFSANSSDYSAPLLYGQDINDTIVEMNAIKLPNSNIIIIGDKNYFNESSLFVVSNHLQVKQIGEEIVKFCVTIRNRLDRSSV